MFRLVLSSTSKLLKETTLSAPAIRTFVTSDGYEHHYRHWTPTSKPRATIVALHGIQSHSGWYEYSSNRLCEAGYEVLFLDRRGSGLNAEPRGYARHEMRLINDVVQLLKQARRQRDEQKMHQPIGLLGLSWGGKLAAAVASLYPELVDLLVLLYPGLFSRIRASAWDNFRLNLARFGDVLMKRVPIPLQDLRLFTDQPEWCQYIESDPLSLREVTVSFLLANRELDRITQSAAAAIHCPVFMALAGRDRIIDNEAVQTFYWSLATRDRELQQYPSACHTLEFDPVRDTFVRDLCCWLDRHSETGLPMQ